MNENQASPEGRSSSKTGPLKRQSHSSTAPPNHLEMRIHEWEVWHTYASYLRVTKVDIDQAARSLVESGIALCSMLQNGRTYWSSDQSLCSGNTTVDLGDHDGTATIRVEYLSGPDDSLTGFAREAWYQAGYFLVSEKKIFGNDLYLPSSYVRAFLGQCNLIVTDHPESKILIYPTILIYESGVILLEMRTIGRDSSVSLQQFISDSVNLFQMKFERAEVPPRLAMLATKAYYHSRCEWSFQERRALAKLQRKHNSAVLERTKHYNEGAFGFDLAPMSSRGSINPEETLTSFSRTVFHTIAFILGRPRSGLAFLLRGQKQTLRLGEFWSGRPHIHLVRFENQCDTASENERRHATAFQSVLFRAPVPDPFPVNQSLPRDCRLFDDYNVYITSAATLWIWSKGGIDRLHKWKDANRGYLIYPHQATVELLEYGYMLHRSLLENAEEYGNLDEVFAARGALIKLRKDMMYASCSGEIMDLLNHGWTQFKVPELREMIDETLRLHEARKSNYEARMTVRFGHLLTILFGLVATSSLAKQVVEPVWKWLNIPRPIDDITFQMLANGVSLSTVVILILLLLRLRRV